MRSALTRTYLASLLMATTVTAIAQEQNGTGEAPTSPDVESPLPTGLAPGQYSCTHCHGTSGILTTIANADNLIVSDEDLVADVHWQEGLRCHDCHGGSPSLDDFVEHRADPTFRSVASPRNIPGFCGHCHSDILFMRQYNPSPRTDQEALYWTSGHGMKLKETGDEQVAHCVDCHGGRHSIMAVDSVDSPVYPTNVADTCQHCHADAQLMEGRTYQGRPIGHDQYAQWQDSVHAKALQQGDTSAATCNDCHGNHAAVPPQVDSVANACGTCHSKVAGLFSDTLMQHRFEEVGLPGCVTCHGNHKILEPTDEMLGMTEEAVCARCHAGGRYGATTAGAETARQIRQSFEQLKEQIAEAEEKIATAERLGMPIGGPRYNLRSAREALTEARTEIHAFAADPVQSTLKQGIDVATEVIRRTEDVLWQYDFRRIWLAVSLLPILILIVLLLLYIRVRGTVGPTQSPGAEGKDSSDAGSAAT